MRHNLIASIFVLLLGSHATPTLAVSIVLPPTGQTTCQDMNGLPITCAGTGQDGELRRGGVLSGDRFTLNSHIDGDSVTDNLTTLVWAKDANLLFNRDLSFDTDGYDDPDGRISTSTALAYIDKLNTENFGGHNDWRLPNRNELMSLIDTERVNPALPSGHPFINVQNSEYGTNSADKGRPGTFTWLVNMKSGTVGTGYSDATGPVNFWPVRGGSWSGPGGKAYLPATNQKLCYDYSSYSSTPVPCATTSGQDGNLQKGVAWPEFRFSSLDEGTVRDALTNLVWTASSDTPGPAACNPGVNKNWLEAFEYIACLNTNAYLGASNWRMPNRNELSSLSYIEGDFPPVDHPFDVNNSYFLFHSSTPVAADSTTVGWSEEMSTWTVRMDGWVSMQGKANHYPVWPVRDFQIVLPTTGQTTSYVTGDDGALRRGLTASPPRFNDLGNDTVYDTLTGLTWAKFVNANGPEMCVPSEPKNRTGAFAFINCLNSETFLGYIDWRLPNRNELMSLVDSGQANPALPAGHPFQGMPVEGASFWTNSNGEFSDYGWYVDFSNGTTGPETFPGQTHHVWAVHEGDWEGPPTMAFIPATGQTTPDGTGSDGDLRLGVAWPAPRFSDNGNGTVTDNLTAMVWTKDANTPDPDPTSRSACNQETTLIWADALNHVTCLNNSNYLGFSDWRLPNRREMASIIDMEQRRPAIPTGHPFSNLQNNFSYWSSTTAAADTTKAIVIGMGMGGESLWAKGDALPVWPVRGGLFMPSDTTKPVVDSLVFAGYSNALTIQITEFTASDNVGVTDYCLSETNSSAGCSWISSAPTSHTFAGVGLRSLYAFARDAIGNVSDSVRRVVFIDMTPPVITGFTIPATHTSSTLKVPVTLQATDNAIITGYCLNEINDAATCNWQETKPADYTFSAEGTVTLFAFVKDVAGNISEVSVASGVVIYFVPVRLPQTGQTVRHVMGDDASLHAGMAWPIPRFINNGDGSVTDELTTLIWSLDAGTPGPEECNPAATKNWQEALDHVACLNTNVFLGYIDWRLPNINELRSLLSFHNTSTGDSDYEYFLPLFHPFAEVHNTYAYWSSTSAGTIGETPAAMAVTPFANGYLSIRYPQNLVSWVWPVRGGVQQTEPTVRSYVLKTGQTTSYYPGDDGALQVGATIPPSENRFTANADSTTTDLLTDLTWTSNIVPADSECSVVNYSYSFSANLITCLNSKNYLGYSDWRLPNLVELGSLQIWAVSPDALPADHPFTGLGESSFWSSDNIHYRYYDPININLSSTAITSFAWFLGWGETLLTPWNDPVGATPSSVMLVRGGVYEDVQLPRIENFQLPVVSADLMISVSNLDFIDNAGVIYFCLTENDNTNLCDWQRAVSNVNSRFVMSSWNDYGKQRMLPFNYTFSTEGDKTLYAFASDAWGNISTGTAATIRVDTTIPVVTGVSLPVRYASQTVPVTLTATDNLAIADYCLSEINSSNNCVWQSTLPTSFTFTSDGIKTLFAYVRDTAGNVSLGTTPANVTIDSADPTISVFTLQKTPLSLTVQTTFTATDFNGVNGYCVGEINNSADCLWQATAPTGYTFSAQGSYTLYAFARDTYGNVSSRSAVIGIDFEPPVINGLILPSHSTSLTIPVTSFTATDNFPDLQYCLIEINSAAGCLWQSVIPASFTFRNEGSLTVYAFVKDIGDNVSEPMSANVIVDSVLPIITEFTIPSLSGSLEIPVTLTATDNIAVTGYCLTLEGTVSSCIWQPTPPTTYTFPNSGMRGVTAFVRDGNGNVRQYATTRIITIDTIPPAILSFVIPDAATSLTVAVNQLTVFDVTTVTYCLRENSDPAGCLWTDTKPTSFTFSSSGNRTLYAFAKDAGGNVSTPASRSIFIDTNPPVITSYTIPATSDSLTVPVTITATDNSGVVAGYCLREVQSIAGCVWNPTPPTSYTFSTDGARSLYAFAIDAGGYVSNGRVASITIAALQPVRISSATPVYYATLQGAYNVAVSNNVIQLKAGNLTNDLLANRNITVTLEGGAYSTLVPNTTIRGIVRIQAGKTIMKNVYLSP